ncbi:MAG: M48 family metalloprotease, partial [Gemmatimonadales bacterium]|nr:M48 family metalloprotease [Gemmatimonadales bacterium]
FGGAPLAAQGKAHGYADFRLRDTLVVDGQRIVAGRKVKVKGAADLAAIPVGWEVKVDGKRAAQGYIEASKVEARKNGTEKGEAEIKAASDQAEQAWVAKGMMYQPAEDGSVLKIGDILESGPYVQRARRIMDRLRPEQVPASALRVRVVRTKEWNASAMANGAIWVYTGLMDAMDDDELAIVLGHELAHYTYEHSRRNVSKGGLGQILGVGAEIAGAVIGGTGGAIAQLGGQLGASALLSGYSREFEDQADRVGLRYVHEAGYDVRKGPGLWTKFKEKYGEEDKLSNFFAGDHSRPTERIGHIKDEIRWNYPDTPAASE